jgi:flagellar biosynthesis/type III secretory pathway protein FliH
MHTLCEDLAKRLDKLGHKDEAAVLLSDIMDTHRREVKETYDKGQRDGERLLQYRQVISADRARHEGHDIGYKQGLAIGRLNGHVNGYDKGKRDGEQQGFAEGLAKGKSESRLLGRSQLEDAYNEGHKAGRARGYTQGHRDGAHIAKAERQAIFHNGYEDGRKDTNTFKTGHDRLKELGLE